MKMKIITMLIRNNLRVKSTSTYWQIRYFAAMYTYKYSHQNFSQYFSSAQNWVTLDFSHIVACISCACWTFWINTQGEISLCAKYMVGFIPIYKYTTCIDEYNNPSRVVGDDKNDTTSRWQFFFYYNFIYSFDSRGLCVFFIYTYV